MTKVIAKNKIKDLLRETTKEWTTYVPQKHIGDDVLIDMLPKENLENALDNIALGDANVIISPKEIFFPQVETLFEFKDGEIKETIEVAPKMLFGVKACDLKAILFCDEFFKRNYEDIYYLSRMKDRFIVAIGCLNPPRPNACFCTSTGTGPFAEKGYDLQLIDNGDEYLIEVGSDKGKEFLAKYKDYFKDFTGDAPKTIKKVKDEAANKVTLKVDFEKALKLMTEKDFEENYKRIGDRCISCGGCVYACPTCTCFNVYDNAIESEGTRVRTWDGCVFSGYTREASGHNPRSEKWQTTARRYEHKLKYDYIVAEMSGCVGCGRCLTSCPVEIGMSKFIQEITEGKKLMLGGIEK